MRKEISVVFGIAVLLALAASFAGAAATPVPQSVCDRYQVSCSNCTYYEGCGWSVSQRKCLAGIASRSNDGSSSGSDWKWYSRDCSAAPTPTPRPSSTPQLTCSSKSSCESCTETAGCGWTLSHVRCLAGNSTNSNDGSSRGMDWVWFRGSCPSQCPSYPTCLNCTYHGECGWSAQQAKCLYGNTSRSYDGSSSGSDWTWVNSSCTGYSPTPIRSPTPRPTLTHTPVHTATPFPTPTPGPGPQPCCYFFFVMLATGAGTVLAIRRK